MHPAVRLFTLQYRSGYLGQNAPRNRATLRGTRHALQWPAYPEPEIRGLTFGRSSSLHGTTNEVADFRLGTLQDETIVYGTSPRRAQGSYGVGMFDFVEPRVRRLVVEQLGIGADELSPIVSLRDDFAADSLDLTELAMAIEQDLGIVMTDAAMADVRTYGDLLAVVEAARRATKDALEAPPAEWRR
jgi:acyl carrier protein